MQVGQYGCNSMINYVAQFIVYYHKMRVWLSQCSGVLKALKKEREKIFYQTK